MTGISQAVDATPEISLIVPVFNEEETISIFMAAVTPVMN